MKSKEPRSTFKNSWGTMKDNISYPTQSIFSKPSSPTSPSLSTTSITPSTQSAESSSSGFDSLILRRERSVPRLRSNVRNAVTNNANVETFKPEVVRDINHNHSVHNKVVENNNKITQIFESKKSQILANLNRTKGPINAVRCSTNQCNKTKEEKQIQHVKNKQYPQVKVAEGYVGFSCLKSQILRKHLQKGFEFTLMVVGETGLGKSTLINSMFLTDIYLGKRMVKSPKTMKVEAQHVVLKEGEVKLSLTVVDTPGYGDAVDNTECLEPIVEYVEEQLDKFLEAETRVKRECLPDSRVHACLHFIAPTGHGLKRLDVEVMKRLQDKVNIIPVIGKADACTREELEVFKQNIIHQLKLHKIQTYQFPELEDCQNLPFALVGSNMTMKGPEGQVFRCRKYPWGAVNIEDEAHCDFSLLRRLLLSKHMEDMKDVTNRVHYENFRSKKLSVLAAIDEEKLSIPNKNPLAVLEDETQEHMNKIKLMEKEMEDVFKKKVEQKIKKMDNIEKENYAKISEENKFVNELKEELKSQRDSLERQKSLFDAQLLLSPSLSTNSTASVGSRGKKKLFRFSIGSFKFRSNDLQ